MVHRVWQLVLVVSTLLASWLGMQLVHELGHVAGAQWTGGKVSRVVLHPLTISRTDLSSNPKPLAVVWAGPTVGVVAPLALWGLSLLVRLPAAFVLRFFAGFCLIANGLYIGVGSIDGVGDCGEMLRNGSRPWQLWLFGALTVPLGFAMWHGQGAYFGWGINRRPISARIAGGCLATCLVLSALGFVVGGN